MKKTMYILVLMILLLVFSGCSNANVLEKEKINKESIDSTDKAEKSKVVVYHAGSLSVPLANIERGFEEKYPNIDIVRTPGGSRTIARKAVELGDNVDILISADYNIIKTLLMPKNADFNLLFAKNSMVLMYSTSSIYSDEINTKNWYDIITRHGVDFGYSDPNSDPCGYRSLLLWQLAEKYYKIDGLNKRIIASSKEKNVRPKAVELLSMLETGELDYAFEYKSVAIQHSKTNPDLKYIELPDEINMSSLKFKDFYSKAIVKLNGSEPETTTDRIAEPIIYSLTIPNNFENREGGILFIKYLLSDEGQNILKESGQPLLDSPEVVNYDKLPEELKEIIEKN